MLFNPDAYRPPPTVLDQFIAWLERKDPDEWYDWRYENGCACAQFYGAPGWRQHREFTLINSIARGANSVTDETDWTFGQCLERAKHYRAHQHLGWMAPA